MGLEHLFDVSLAMRTPPPRHGNTLAERAPLLTVVPPRPRRLHHKIGGCQAEISRSYAAPPPTLRGILGLRQRADRKGCPGSRRSRQRLRIRVRRMRRTGRPQGMPRVDEEQATPAHEENAVTEQQTSNIIDRSDAVCIVGASMDKFAELGCTRRIERPRPQICSNE